MHLKPSGFRTGISTNGKLNLICQASAPSYDTSNVVFHSIPKAQIIVSLCNYPRLAVMPRKIQIVMVLFAFFIFLCGAGHLMRYIGQSGGTAFRILNWLTAVVSVATALYLLPLVPDLMSNIDDNLQIMELQRATAESKKKLLTFMAFLCHEIRNPLFAITATLHFLDDEDMTVDQTQAISSISQSTSLMLRLVNDVLDLSKLEHGKLELEERDFDLRGMLQNVAYNTGAQIRQQRGGVVSFAFDIDSHVPHVIRGDSVRILQIVYNLMSNAVKFTESGRIDCRMGTCSYLEAIAKGYIRSSASRRGQDTPQSGSFEGEQQVVMGLLQSAEEGTSSDESNDGTVVLKFSISDTGPGIPPDRLAKIFVPYSQSKMSDYRKHGGTGLGLSIISKLLHSMRGSIHVTSEVGLGSTFTVYIPVKSTRDEDAHGSGGSPASLMELLPSRLLPSVPGIVGPDDVDDVEMQSNSTGLDPLSCRSVHSERSIGGRGSGLTPQRSFEMTGRPRRSLPKFEFPPGDNVVLIVDDNAVNRKLLARMLAHFGLEYRQACNGQEAVDIVLESRNVTSDPQDAYIGVILMDMSMPVMSGCQATRKLIRQLKIQVPIIALTTNAIDESRAEALEAGSTEFVTKPILRDELYDICQRHLGPGQGAIV